MRKINKKNKEIQVKEKILENYNLNHSKQKQ